MSKRIPLVIALILVLATVIGCQAAQTTQPAQPAGQGQAGQNPRDDGQSFALQLPAELPQDPMAGSGNVQIVQGAVITMSRGRIGVPGAEDGGQATPGTGRQSVPGSGGQRPSDGGGQGAPGGGGQRPSVAGGQAVPGFGGPGAMGTGAETEVEVTAKTKYYKNTAPMSLGNQGAQGEAQVQPKVEEAILDDVKAGSFLMVWGSTIDGRIIADVVYIQNLGR